MYLFSSTHSSIKDTHQNGWKNMSLEKYQVDKALSAKYQ